jgi:type II secretory pathway component PulJ
VKIDFLFWQECPSYPKAWERLQAVLNRLGLQAELHRVEIYTDKDAVQHAFPGSPTIRINGRDIDPEGAREQRVGLSCRIYHDATGRITPVPPEELIQRALKNENNYGGSP